MALPWTTEAFSTTYFTRPLSSCFTKKQGSEKMGGLRARAGWAGLGSASHSQLRQPWRAGLDREETVAIDSFIFLFFFNQECPITDLRK